MAFYVCNCLASIQLIQIARHWSHILSEWSFVEMSMRSYGYQVNLKKTFVILTSLFMGVGLGKYILDMVVQIRIKILFLSFSGTYVLHFEFCLSGKELHWFHRRTDEILFWDIFFKHLYSCSL